MRGNAPVRIVGMVVGLASLLPARPPETWLRVESPHFELLTAGSEKSGRSVILGLERLWRLFLPGTPPAAPQSRIRIIAFGSAAEYAPYRLSENADAYYVGAPGRDYIVLALTAPGDLATAGHEYAHFLLRREGLKLPPWLAEGLAEVVSTVRFGPRFTAIGGPKRDRISALRHQEWLSIAELTGVSTELGGRERRNLFYAQSWALVHMLMFAPAYRERFQDLLAGYGSGIARAR